MDLNRNNRNVLPGLVFLSKYGKFLGRSKTVNLQKSDEYSVSSSDGVGLVLSRKAGERIFLTADPSFSDSDIIKAMRQGFMITLVSVTGARHLTTEEPNAIQRPGKGLNGSARIGLKGAKCLTFMREEIILGELPEIAIAPISN